MLVYGKCECFVMKMFYVCVLCASCGSSQCCILHDLQFVNAGRGYRRQPYETGILQSWSHNCLVGSNECLLLFTPSCCSECYKQHSLDAVKLSQWSGKPCANCVDPSRPINRGPITIWSHSSSSSCH